MLTLTCSFFDVFIRELSSVFSDRDTVDYLLKKIRKYEHTTNHSSHSGHVNQLLNNNII